jgi:hypothetical protein
VHFVFAERGRRCCERPKTRDYRALTGRDATVLTMTARRRFGYPIHAMIPSTRPNVCDCHREGDDIVIELAQTWSRASPREELTRCRNTHRLPIMG